MSETIELTGMVVSAMPVGEYDKRLVLLTREEGKITAFARGARRPKSTLLAPSNPFVTGSFSLIPGRNAYSLVSASVRNYFTELAAEMPGIYYGFYFLEFASYYGREGVDATDSLNLLYLALRALMNHNLDDRLVRCIYEMRLMVIGGEYAPPSKGMSEAAMYACRYICTAPIRELFSFGLEESALKELTGHMEQHRRRYIDRRMKSLEILEQFTD